MSRRPSINIILISAFLLIQLFVAGCGGKKAIRPESVPSVLVKKEINPLGYTIQVGAFSQITNAVRLTENIQTLGLDAYYFRHERGLFKVRFGNFANREEAETIAKQYVSSGQIEDYFIVGPDDYPLAKIRIHGTGALRAEIVKTAESFIGLPYKWGGYSPQTGFDCSGLSMAVYHLNGLNLPRTSAGQYKAGMSIDKKNISKGDLVFFKTTNGRGVWHVGIYTGDGSFIHAPGKGKDIRIDSLSNRYYAARYAGARRYIR
jgi:cell wall-associated NlpC family hydrolase